MNNLTSLPTWKTETNRPFNMSFRGRGGGGGGRGFGRGGRGGRGRGGGGYHQDLGPPEHVVGKAMHDVCRKFNLIL